MQAEYFSARNVGAARRQGEEPPGLRLAQKVARQTLARHRELQFSRLLHVPGACGRPSAWWWERDRTSRREPEEPSPVETSKSIHTFTRSDTPLPWKPSQLLKPSSGRSGPILLDQGSWPGGNRGWEKRGSSLGPLPGSHFPGRLPSKGARQRRDWWSRRRNTS